jgi:cyclase
LWADKISINSPALDNPDFINELVWVVWSQAVVIWIDSYFDWESYYVYKYTGSEKTIQNTKLKTSDWIKEVVKRWAWEIVLNCINQDWVRKGYDIEQLKIMWEISKVPLVASWWAGEEKDFLEVFEKTKVTWALAASVFHYDKIDIKELKKYLKNKKILWE